ncbi:MAG: dCTP deaminase domain-containing protein [Pyrinomonadaceae bacterium]
MSFWNTDKLVLKQSQQKLIEPFEPQFAKQGAYELSLGPEAFITSEPNATKQMLSAGDQLSIPAGQFGLLLTEEVVTIPDDAIGFISVRFTIKRRGLVNVSGFHVDPGFSGRLKFAVYNAGSQPIVVSRGERVFMIWFSDLSASTPDPYQGESLGQKEITSQDVMFIQGEVASPAALNKKIEELKGEYQQRLTALDDKIATWRGVTIGILTSLIVGVVVGAILLALRLFFDGASPPHTLPAAQPSATVQESNRNQPDRESPNSANTQGNTQQ